MAKLKIREGTLYLELTDDNSATFTVSWPAAWLDPSKKLKVQRYPKTVEADIDAGGEGEV
jgi:hypothetical protein